MGAEKYGNGLAQDNCEELEASLVIEIDRCTERLWENLSSAVGVTNHINNRLLCPELNKSEKDISDRKEPEGWFESHLEKLEILHALVGQVLANVNKLDTETKTDTK